MGMKEKTLKRLLKHKDKEMGVVERFQPVSGSQGTGGSLASPLAEQRMLKPMRLMRVIVTRSN